MKCSMLMFYALLSNACFFFVCSISLSTLGIVSLPILALLVGIAVWYIALWVLICIYLITIKCGFEYVYWPFTSFSLSYASSNLFSLCTQTSLVLLSHPLRVPNPSPPSDRRSALISSQFRACYFIFLIRSLDVFLILKKSNL